MCRFGWWVGEQSRAQSRDCGPDWSPHRHTDKSLPTSVEARIQGSATRSSASVVAVSGEREEAAAADASAASLGEACGRKKARGPCAPKARRTRREAVAPVVAGWVVGGVGLDRGRIMVIQHDIREISSVYGCGCGAKLNGPAALASAPVAW